MLKLYSFYLDCGRMGELEGLFVEDEVNVEPVMGSTVHFGEVLGKHSDIDGVIDEESIKCVSDDFDKIQWLITTMKGFNISGINPIDLYYEQNMEEE